MSKKKSAAAKPKSKKAAPPASAPLPLYDQPQTLSLAKKVDLTKRESARGTIENPTRLTKSVNGDAIYPLIITTYKGKTIKRARTAYKSRRTGRFVKTR